MRLTLLVLLAILLTGRAALGQVTRAQSPSFVVRSYCQTAAADDVLAVCRSLRDEIRVAWFDDTDAALWRPPCEVVVHAHRASYLAAVGRGGGQTMGSSLTETSRGRVVRRRIDLLVDDTGDVPALAHELTHIILADRFDSELPRWANEGIALLADTPRKQSLHRRDLTHALRTGTTFRLAELLSFQRPTSAEQVAVFYGQSLSLVRFLLTRRDQEQLAAFLETSQAHGYEHGLREVYDIDGIPHLERLWRQHAERTEVRPVGLLRQP